MKLTGVQLRHLQLAELEMLEEVDRVCQLAGISYQIIAGTLLGAVRHRGFIPWDDDVDVAMLRPEYEKFRVACEEHLDRERFWFQDHRTCPGYRWGYGKLRRKHSLFLRSGQEHMPYEQGIFLDVFPIDFVPNNYPLRCLKSLECFLVRKALYAKVGRISEKNSIKRTVYSLLDKIPEEQILEYYDDMVRRASRKETKWARILLFPTPNHHCGYLSKWYRDSAQYSFEGRFFPGIREADSYLRFKFGDYNTLPPEEKRKVHPVSHFRLPEQISSEDLLELLKNTKAFIIGKGFVANMFDRALEKYALSGQIIQHVNSEEAGTLFREGKLSPDTLCLIAVHESVLEEVLHCLDRNSILNRFWIYPNIPELLYGEKVAEGKLISISDILHAQIPDYYWIEVRYAAILGMDGICPNGEKLYIKAMGLHCSQLTAEKRLKQLRNLKKSVSERGYQNDHPILVDENYQIIDGLHRFALCLYYGIDKIPCDIVKATAENESIFRSTVGEENRLTHAVLQSPVFSDRDRELLEDVRVTMYRQIGEAKS